MGAKPTYEELAEAIACCMHTQVYGPEPYGDRWKMIVDNMCASYYEIPTAVLVALGILKSLDCAHRRYDFTCIPDDFLTKIVENKERGCGYDELVIAMICLLEYHPNQPDIYAYLARLGVCEPFAEDGTVGSKWSKQVEVRWTDKRAYYLKLERDWDWHAVLESVPLKE